MRIPRNVHMFSTAGMAARMRLFTVLFPLLLLAACSSLPRPDVDYRVGAEVETLSTAVSVTIHTADSGMSGHGFMVYRRPDQLHLVMLSPFGTTLLEAFARGDQITLVYPSRSTAYSGPVSDLPLQGGLQGWSMMRWVMDVDRPGSGMRNGTLERRNTLGGMEKVTFENGLVTAKVSADGSRVYYSRYAVFDGVPLATEIDLRNDRNDQIRLVLDEPEINLPLDDAALLPRLDGMTILPLSDIKGL